MTLTETAQDKWVSLLESLDLTPETIGLRLAIKGGGCSGFKKEVDFSPLDEVAETDIVQEFGEVSVITDIKSMLYLHDAIIDYKDSLMGAGFLIEIPSAKNTCGCGDSFST
tara:strand:+ start:436 stop:768 length:333 start_codon:yes stop_codon:yes gene_type:complete